MELGIKDRLQVNVKMIEYSLLVWFPNCQFVSDFMACLAGSLLNALTCTLHVGAMTGCDDFMACLAGSLLNALTCTLHVGAMTVTLWHV
ncbi:hypothetical protein EDD16DRAFT_1623214 [Pisolithus croceorrhizus]|nr:hypothetical protein EDD16DRAFT_1623214 [Pisolithus croceorrhizus]